MQVTNVGTYRVESKRIQDFAPDVIGPYGERAKVDEIIAVDKPDYSRISIYPNEPVAIQASYRLSTSTSMEDYDFDQLAIEFYNWADFIFPVNLFYPERWTLKLN